MDTQMIGPRLVLPVLALLVLASASSCGMKEALRPLTIRVAESKDGVARASACRKMRTVLADELAAMKRR